MKKIILFFIVVLGAFFNCTAQTYDTAITIRKIYHLKSENGHSVDSIVEMKITKNSKKETALSAIERKKILNSIFLQEPVSTNNRRQTYNYVVNPRTLNSYVPVSGTYQSRIGTWEKTRNFSEKHPELKEGEIFISNVGKDWRSNSLYAEYKKYKTVREGKVAYDVRGNKVNDYVPLFVKTSEYEKN